MLESMRSQRVGHNLATEQGQQLDVRVEVLNRKLDAHTHTHKNKIKEECPTLEIHVYIYIHTYTHAYIPTYIYIHTHTHTYTHTHTHKHTLEKAMAPHSSTLAWKIPKTEEPGGLPSMGSHRVRHD